VQRSFSSPIEISDEDIINEAKAVLVGENLEEEICRNVKKVLQPWIGQPFNQYRMYDPKVAVEYYLQSLVDKKRIYQFHVMTMPDRSISVQVRNSPIIDTIISIIINII